MIDSHACRRRRVVAAAAALSLLTAPLLACAPAPSPAQERASTALGASPPFAVKQRDLWPTEAWPAATPEEVGVDPAALARLSDYLFARNGDDHDRKGQRTNAFLLIKDGRLVYERYARGTTPDTPVLTWSVSKSLAGTLVGAAVHAGHLALDDRAAAYYPPLDREGHRELRITDLLRMSSGLAWNEAYEASPVFSSVMAMLYTRGHADMPRFVAEHDLAHTPGTHWSYSSGDTNLLLAALRGAVGEAAYPSYPWTALFEPLGMTSARWERDLAGNLVGSSYLYASARDLAKWAFLLLNDGVWDGRRLLPAGWVAYSLTMAPAYYTTEIPPALHEDNPGAQLYLNLGDPERQIPPPWPAAPSDTFAAQGHWGKSIFVFPSLDMIAVRMGDDREYGCGPAMKPGCVADRERAFTKTYYLELLTGLVQR